MNRNKVERLAAADAILIGGVTSIVAGVLIAVGLGAALMVTGAIMILYWLIFTE